MDRCFSFILWPLCRSFQTGDARTQATWVANCVVETQGRNSEGKKSSRLSFIRNYQALIKIDISRPVVEIINQRIEDFTDL